MLRLDADELLDCWERGRESTPLERVVMLLASAGIESPGSLALGEANRLLLALRVGTFGPRFEGRATCLGCGASCGFDVDVEALGASLPASQAERTASIRGVSALVRPIRLEDLLAPGDDAMAAARGAGTAAELVARCAGSIMVDDRAIAAEALDHESIAGLADAVIAADPAALITLSLCCPECGAGWEAPFDPAATLWTEVDAAARRLLEEVHLLARGYGWRERDVLSLSAARREAYVQLLTGVEP